MFELITYVSYTDQGWGTHSYKNMDSRIQELPSQLTAIVLFPTLACPENILINITSPQLPSPPFPCHIKPHVYQGPVPQTLHFLSALTPQLANQQSAYCSLHLITAPA